MASYLKRVLRKIGSIAFEEAEAAIRRNGNSQEIQVLLWHHYKQLVATGQELPGFDEVGFRCYSQFEEDGILLYLFALIGIETKIAVEICAGSGLECNSTNLIINHGWNGFLFDGRARKVEKGKRFFAKHDDTFLWPPRFTQAWITAENVNEIIRSAGAEGPIDLLSLDIDGMDYWVWKAIDCISPRVVVCETHNPISPDRALTVPYDPEFKLKTADYNGASLLAMTKLGAAKGYRLVGTHRFGFNAFFVRADLANELLPPVTPESCVQDAYSTHARRERWPKVKDLDWIEV